MKKVKFIFYIIFCLYIAISLAMGLWFDEICKLLGIGSIGKIKLIFFILKKWSLLGIFLLIMEWVVENIRISDLKHKNKELEGEILKLKAALYDRSEEDKDEESAISTNNEKDPDQAEDSVKEDDNTEKENNT